MQTYSQKLVTGLATADGTKERTQALIDWMQKAPNDIRMRFALNWTMPHSIFNILSTLVESSLIQNIYNYYQVFKSKEIVFKAKAAGGWRA